MTVPLDPDFIRRDVLNCKAMGMNMIRSFNGLAPRRLLDFCDELGFLVNFHQCLAWMAGLRKLGVNAIRSNPNVIGHSVTGTQDQGLTGEGLTATVFRELKPGVVDAMFDAFYPLRWCLFVEPMHVYRGQQVRLEAVLANEDALQPGDYPVRLQIVGPRGSMVFDRTKVAGR